MTTIPETSTDRPALRMLLVLGVTSTFLILFLLSVGIIGIVTPPKAPGVAGIWLNTWHDNWLVLLYQMNITGSGYTAELLSVYNSIDMALMYLFDLLFIALYLVIRKQTRFFAALITILPFLGVVLLIFTHTAGRSALLIGVLLYSILMLRSAYFTQFTASCGIFGSILLFFGGDIASAILPPSPMIALVILIGYLLWIFWVALTGIRLLQIRKKGIENWVIPAE
jgi:hypothetical protein